MVCRILRRRIIKEMKTSIFIINILAIALPSLLISPLLLIRIATIVLLCASALSISVDYIQSIGSGTVVCSGLFLFSLVPVKPADAVPSRRLTNLEKQQFSLSAELKQTLVGLLLGDLYAHKQNLNVRLRFKQGTIYEGYLMHLYDLFKSYCSAPPKTTSQAPDLRTGKVYSSIYFNTYSYPVLTKSLTYFILKVQK